MKVKKGFKLRTVGDEYIIAGEGLEQIDFNKLISLNSSAAFLWQEVEGKEFDVMTLADLLVSEYNIPVSQAELDADDILKSWLEIGIIEK